MRHILHKENIYNKYSLGILIKESAFIKAQLEQYYVEPLGIMGINPIDIISYDLEYNDNNKAPAGMIRKYLDKFLQALDEVHGITTLLVNDSTYFKVLAGVTKSEPHHGYILPCAIKGREHMNVILGVNYQALFHNPLQQEKITMSLKTVARHIQGTHVELGKDIIHSEFYPSRIKDIRDAFKMLLGHPELTCDIEGFGLGLDECGIGTIAFAWDQHNGVAFAVEYGGDQLTKDFVKDALKIFFELYSGTLIYHGSTFDIKHIIWTLFMDEPLDLKGMLHGLDIMFRSIHDTKIITYLATNTTAGNKLDLKSNAFEFAGNYAQDDIKDITLIKPEALLRYNLTDCLATWYVYHKNKPKMTMDQQDDIYNEIMLPSLKVICQMELTGMPLDMEAVLTAERALLIVLQGLQMDLESLPTMDHFRRILRMEALLTKRASLKVKKVYERDFLSTEYNPASNKQTAKLLHEHFKLPVIDTTDTGLPSVGAKTLKKHLNQLILEHNITEDELK